MEKKKKKTEEENQPKADHPQGGKDKVITMEIPAEGSLGLLALGAVGLKAWREKRDEVLSKQLKK